ncbi:hypothetical protein [Streptomyces avermitilis]|uniref:hypothetical protein n=1 Tax=Streptomyces avermitilis TaxID=33903 RepID=UPI0037F723B5
MGVDRERMNVQDERRVARTAERTTVVEALHGRTGATVALDTFKGFAKRVMKEAAPAQVMPGESGERLYLAEFVGRGGGQFVKVGLSGMYWQPGRLTKPLRWHERIQEHRTAGKAHGFTLVDLWVSPPLWNQEEAEDAAKEALVATGAQVENKEYFHQLPFDQALDVVLSLPLWPLYLDMDWEPGPGQGATD